MSEDIDWNDVESKAQKQKDIKINALHIWDLFQELKNAQNEIKAKEEELEKLQADFELQSDRIEELCAEAEKPSKNEELTNELSDLRTKVAQLQADVLGKQQLIAQMEKDYTEAKERISKLENQVESGASGEMQDKLDELKQTITAKEQEIDELNEKIAQVSAGVSKGDGKVSLAREKEEFELEKKRLFKEMEDFEVNLRIEMEGKDERIKELEEKISLMGSKAPDQKPKVSAPSGPAPTRESLLKKLDLPSKYESDVAFVPTSGDRIVCPKCGNPDVKVEQDRTRVLTYMGGVPYYAKKYSCKKCMFDFRVD